MKTTLKEFENKKPLIVFEWKDAFSEAEGWLVINSLRGGAAGGGTRMRAGLDRREVESLAKTMEVKFTVSGPPIGGAKSGINFDPRDPRKWQVLQRWYAAVSPILKSYYGTGGDLNVDEIHEVIPITEECGIWHPQEGVLMGHFNPAEPGKIRGINNLRKGVTKIITNPDYTHDLSANLCVADTITGFGVAEAVRHYYDLWGGSLQGTRVIVQGWGNVGGAAAYFCTTRGAKIVGIIDRAGGIIDTNGLGQEHIKKLLNNRKNMMLTSDDLISFDEAHQKIWDVPCDVFLPCAASRLVQEEQLNRLIQSGLQVISCGANVPFADSEIFYGPIAEKADTTVSLLPDFVANCGMARVFSYLMSLEDENITDAGIFEDTSAIIKNALQAIKKKSPERTLITQQAFSNALQQLM